MLNYRGFYRPYGMTELVPFLVENPVLQLV